MSGDFLTPLHGLKSTLDKTEDGNTVSGSENCCSRSDEKGLMSEKPHKRGFEDSKIVSTISDQSSIRVSSLSLLLNENFDESLQKNDGKRLRKRACGLSKVEGSKWRKVGEAARVLSPENDHQLPVKVVESLSHTFTQWPRKASNVTISTREMRIAGGKDALSDVKSVKRNVPRSLQRNCRHEDINSEEAALELQQCVSLLRKYGVLKDCDFYLSQNLPRCVPHPGSVGDGLLSKVCKTCGALEDANGTVICDKCEEAFHLSCFLPRMRSKYFDREDDWYCTLCKKQKKNVGLKLSTEGSSSLCNVGSFKLSQSESIDSSGSPFSVDISYNSRVRLGPAHQADVPLWANSIEDNDLEFCVADHPGMQLPLSQKEKNGEKDRILKSFEQKIQLLRRIPTKVLAHGMPQNWLKCQCVLERAFKDSDGQKHPEVVCGKWRSAPLNFKQTDTWECFCCMEWDPLHADCAIPQELSTEEVLKRMQENMNHQALECQGVFNSDTLGDTSRYFSAGKSRRKQKKKLDGWLTQD